MKYLIRKVLKEGDFKTLTKIKNNGSSFEILYNGSENNIDEAIGVIYSKGERFVVARLLGENLTTDKMAGIAESVSSVDGNNNLLRQIFKE